MTAPAQPRDDETPEVSVVVPLFNEQATIEELVRRVSTVLGERGIRFEVVLVNDGSTDATAAILERLAGADRALRVFTFPRNYGQSAALCCGIFEARGSVVVTMDGDLQNPPEEIPRLLDALVPGIDLVTARRSARYERTWRWLGSRVVHWLVRLLVGSDIQDFGGQFKAYRREVVEATRSAWAPGKPFFALAVWLGFHVVEVGVRHEPRRVGASRYNLGSLLRLNLDILTSFTTVPLALLAVLSLFTGVPGALGTLWYLASGAPADFGAALSLLLLGLGGVFFAAAALGIYVARTYRTVAGSPTGYVVLREKTDSRSARREPPTQPNVRPPGAPPNRPISPGGT